jgi:hypothetical protein
MWLREFYTLRGLRRFNLDTPPDVLCKFANSDCEVKTGNATVIKVGDVQCVIESNKATRITILFWRGSPSIPDDSFDEKCDWHRDLPIYDILRMIEQSGFSWTVDRRLTFDRQLAILIGENAWIMLDLDRKELHSVSIISSK